MLKADTHLFHALKSREALEAGVLKLRDDLTKFRRGAKQWAIGVAALLILIAAAGDLAGPGAGRSETER